MFICVVRDLTKAGVMAKWFRTMFWDFDSALNTVKSSWRINTKVNSQLRQVSKNSPGKRAQLGLKRSLYERDESGANSCRVRAIGGQQASRCSLVNVGRSTRNGKQWLLPRSGRHSKNASCARLFRTSGHNHQEEPWMMTDSEVSEMIRSEESACKIERGVVDRFETNQLSSNQPVEDRKFVARLDGQDAFVFGVIDGHGGEACAHSVCQRLADYVSAALVAEEVPEAPKSKFPQLAEQMLMVNTSNKYNYREDPKCHESLTKFYLENTEKRLEVEPTVSVHSALAEEQNVHIRQALIKAFVGLDGDICREALIGADGAVDKNAFHAAVSGACAIVAYLKGTELYIANAGDCRAVMGVEDADGTWRAVLLSDDHTAGEFCKLEPSSPLEKKYCEQSTAGVSYRSWLPAVNRSLTAGY